MEQTAHERVRVASVGDDERLPVDERDDRRRRAAIDGLAALSLNQQTLGGGDQRVVRRLVLAYDGMTDRRMRLLEGVDHRLLGRLRHGRLALLGGEVARHGRRGRLARETPIVGAVAVEHAPHREGSRRLDGEECILVERLEGGTKRTHVLRVWGRIRV